MRVVGLLAGVGSLLHEARSYGYEVVGNIDPRPYFRNAPWIWESNFEAPYLSYNPFGDEPQMDLSLEDWEDADLALGHPPCGRHSLLGHTVGGRANPHLSDEERARRLEVRRNDRGMLPLFTSLVRTLRPRAFALDNLPKILKRVAPPEWWEEQLPGYRLSYFTILNWDYGNSQRRERLWVVGVRGKKAFTLPDLAERLTGPTTAWEAFSDLPWEPWKDVARLAHFHRDPVWKPWGGYWATKRSNRLQLGTTTQLARGFLAIPPRENWPYISESGRAVRKMGRCRLPMDGPCRTLSGNETLHHPLTGWPLTPRERARVMGWPDDFNLGHWEDDEAPTYTDYARMIAATGKAVPSEFPRYLIPLLTKHLRKL